MSVIQILHSVIEELVYSVGRQLTAPVVVIEDQVTMTVGGVDVMFIPEPVM